MGNDCTCTSITLKTVDYQWMVLRLSGRLIRVLFRCKPKVATTPWFQVSAYATVFYLPKTENDTVPFQVQSWASKASWYILPYFYWNHIPYGNACEARKHCGTRNCTLPPHSGKVGQSSACSSGASCHIASWLWNTSNTGNLLSYYFRQPGVPFDFS